jgi:hypothetical protein
MGKTLILLLGILFIHPVVAAEKEKPPSIPEEATIGTFLYNLEADQEKGTKLDRQYEEEREEKQLLETESEAEILIQKDESSPD